MASTKIKAQKSPTIKEGTYSVPTGWIKELNFFDIFGDKAKTKGTSNKLYHIELQVTTSGECQLFTQYGATGASNPVKEWRYFAKDKAGAEKEFNSILKSKLRKGYREIDVALRALGSAEAKKQTKAIVFDNVEPKPKASVLHPETARFVTEVIGATNKFVIQTLRCPLGQLTNAQIEEGRACLLAAKQLVIAGNPDKKIITGFTNDFYTLIPHPLGAGARGKMEHLLLDSVQKILQKEDDLDTLLDAKSIGAVIDSDDVDEKYKALNAHMSLVEHKSDLFNWIVGIVTGTRASNHGRLGKIVVLNVWDLTRNNERPGFFQKAAEIAAQCGHQKVPKVLTPYMNRLDIPASDEKLYKQANVLPLFHGTRTQNLPGIIKNGLLIRPAGAVITGDMYGSALYFSSNSTKSINYTSIKSSYWSGGRDDRAYLFLNDCALGNTKIASGSYKYNQNNIKPAHSVWAVGDKSGVLNDEMMLYNTHQHTIRYVIEFKCGGR